MDIMPDKKQLRAGSTALRKHKPVPVMSSRPGVSGRLFVRVLRNPLRGPRDGTGTHGAPHRRSGVEHGGEDAMNISKPISTASRLRATFTSSAAPERAANRSTRRSASIRDSTGGSARGRDAGRDHERTGVLVDRVELSRAGRPLSE